MSKKENQRKKEYLQAVGEWNDFLSSNEENLTFSFKYYQFGKNGGESFEEWEKDEHLADLNNKLKDFSGKRKKELMTDRTLEIYSHYPPDSGFQKPKALAAANIKWARLRLTGRRRLIGFFIEQDVKPETVFYIVFLDKEHRFAPMRPV